MATITYRALDASGCPMYGNGQGNFLSDADAVTQAISTRLKLFAGEWWENLNAGTPVFQDILGVSGAGRQGAALSLVVTNRVLGTPYVLSVSSVTASYDAGARSLSFAVAANTQFGQVNVTYTAPGAQAATLY